MSISITRIGDGTLGICDPGLPCCPHTRHGTNSEGSFLEYDQGIPVHLLGHHGPCNCPHGGIYASAQGSPLSFVTGIPVTRIGDLTICQNCGQPGNHVSGSQLTFTE